MTVDITSLLLGCGVLEPLTALNWQLPGPDPGDEVKPSPSQNEPRGPLVGNMNIVSHPDPEPPPSALLSGLDDPQLECLIETWERLPPHLRKNDVDVVGS